jgi:uncharacterized protein (DUF362 family)
MRTDLTRREFLSVPVGAVLATGCGSRPPFARSDFSIPKRSAVALFAVEDYARDFSDVVLRGLQELSVDVRGRSVFLKPNIVEYERGHAINTEPAVVAGAADAMWRAGAREVVIGEGPGHRRDLEYLLSSTSLLDAVKDSRVRFVDLNHDDVREIPLRSWFTGMRSLALPVSVLAADFVVSLPKLKTHHWAGLTCSMKNFFGVVPGAVYGWPKNILHMRGIDASILDLVSTLRPALTIVDAITAMEGDGPIMGTPRSLGLLAMGSDLAAVDATCARIIGIDPSRVGYLSAAGRFLGNVDPRRIDQRGESLERFRADFALIDALSPLRLR